MNILKQQTQEITKMTSPIQATIQIDATLERASFNFMDVPLDSIEYQTLLTVISQIKDTND